MSFHLLPLWYAQPAQDALTEALPIGNGNMGALVFGGVPRERLVLNEDSLWTGDANPSGEYGSDENPAEGFGAYQAFADLFIEDAEYSGREENYRRTLDLNRALASVHFTREGVAHRRDAFASHPAQVIAWRWKADAPGALSGSIHLCGAHGETTHTHHDTLIISGALNNGLRYEGRAKVIARGGDWQAKDGALHFENCDEIAVYIALGTDYAMDFMRGYRGALPDLARRLEAAASRGFDGLFIEHLHDYRALYGRVHLSLGASSNEQNALPTDERKAAALSTHDPEMEATLFQFGRYLAISSSRDGSLPANLQGLWNVSNTPPWHADYHANINVQMNYWPMEVANLAECHHPFFELVQSQLPAWREATSAAPQWNTADGEACQRGFALRTSHNTMGGLGWEWDDTANAWYAQHFWEHFAFGRDQNFLRETAYPLLKEVVEFWQHHLKELPDGRLVVPNGWSPEHGPREDGVSYNQQIVWDLCTNFLEAAAALGVDAEYSETVRQMREKLVAPQIGRWGQLQEWTEDRDEEDCHHRHTSHLFAVFPGRQISPQAAPELARAAKTSLDARGINEASDVREWSLAWRCALYARLGEGNAAYAMLRQMLSTRNSCSNLFGFHPPMQIDGNFGITAALCEMLLQSHTDEIILLPALPAAWPNGIVQGLRARGGFTVNIEWRNGTLHRVWVSSERGGEAKIRYGEKRAPISLKAGAVHELHAEDFVSI